MCWQFFGIEETDITGRRAKRIIDFAETPGRKKRDE